MRWGPRQPWRAAEYCVVDLETTGLDLNEDVIVSVGAVLVVDGRLRYGSRRYQPVQPDRPVSESAVRVHGLRAQDLLTAPRFDQVAHELASMLEGRVLVAHAAWIEEAFLARALWGSRGRGSGRLQVVDTAALLRATGLAVSSPGHEPDLEDSARRLGLCVHTPHHALGDALTTAELFLAAVGHLERQRPGLTSRELLRTSRQHSLARARPHPWGRGVAQ